MHIEISAKALAVAASTAARVAARKLAVAPIYHHVLLEAGATGLTLTAIDDRMSIRRRAQVEHVHRAGAVCLPADTLSALMSRIMPAAIVTLEHDEEAASVIVSFGRARHAIPCLSADDFPPLATDVYEQHMRVTAEDFGQALAQSSPFMDKDGAAINYRMSGVRFQKTGDRLEIIGASPRHASRLFAACEGDIIPVTVPDSVIPIIGTVIGGGYGQATISTSATKIRFVIDGIEIVSRVLDLEYADLDTAENYLTYGASFVVDPGEVKAALDRVKILAEADAHATRLRNIHIQASSDTLYVYSSLQCVEEIPISDFSGTEGLGMSLADGDLQLILGTVSDEARFFIGDRLKFAARIEHAEYPELGRAFCMGLRIHRPEIPA